MVDTIINNIIYPLKKIFDFQYLYIFSLLDNKEFNEIENIRKNLKKLNNICKYELNNGAIKYSAICLLFDFASRNEENILKSQLNAIDTLSFTQSMVFNINRLVECLNIFYEYKNDKILISSLKILSCVQKYKHQYIPHINNEKEILLHHLLIDGLYDEISNDLNYLNSGIKTNEQSNEYQNLNLKNLINGNSLDIQNNIKIFIKQYMIDRIYDEVINYNNIFFSLEKYLKDNRNEFIELIEGN